MRHAQVVSLALTLALIPGIASAASVIVSEEELAIAIQERANFGLTADYESVRALMLSGLDVGSSEWGIVMTSDEEDEIDLIGRMTFADLAARAVLVEARSLPQFAGAYFDQRTDGGLVVLLVGENPALNEQLASLLPVASRKITFVSAAHTYNELEDAAAALPGLWRSSGAPPLVEMAIDERANQIVVYVPAEMIAAAMAFASSATEALAVPIDVRPSNQVDPLVCTSRDNCVDPMRGGARVRQGSETGPICTMAFHVVGSGGDEQFVTAGHCGYQDSNNWYHQGLPGNGFVGAETATLFPNTLDMMRVQMPDAQASRLIIGSSFLVTSERLPVQGETVCASLGKTQAVDCGSVGNPTVLYCYDEPFESICLNGAQYNFILADHGDSGSPMYVNTANGIIAFGTLVGAPEGSSSGVFAKIHNALAVWGWSLDT